MAELRDVHGLIRAEGVFWDTPDGIVPHAKIHKGVVCPVIAMELMEGVSESLSLCFTGDDLASIFSNDIFLSKSHNVIIPYIGGTF